MQIPEIILLDYQNNYVGQERMSKLFAALLIIFLIYFVYLYF